MAIYRFKLRVTSPFVHSWQADTIFGGLCWVIRDTLGEEVLTGLLAAQKSESPPVVISNGFPGDLLPRPLLPLQLTEDKSCDGKDEISPKDLRKIRWLTLAEFNEIRMGRAFDQVMKEDLNKQWRRKAWQSQAAYHNAVNRYTGTVLLENGLYAEEEFTLCEESGGYVSVYALLHDEWRDRIVNAFNLLGRLGLGGERSSGKGAFIVDEFALFEGFTQPPAPGGVVILSDFVPRKSDPLDGYWKVRTKFARLGGHYAVSGRPFKKPFLAFEAGSCFRPETPKHFYGRMVEGLAPGRPEILQYGLGLALAVDRSCVQQI